MTEFKRAPGGSPDEEGGSSGTESSLTRSSSPPNSERAVVDVGLRLLGSMAKQRSFSLLATEPDGRILKAVNPSKAITERFQRLLEFTRQDLSDTALILAKLKRGYEYALDLILDPNNSVYFSSANVTREEMVQDVQSTLLMIASHHGVENRFTDFIATVDESVVPSGGNTVGVRREGRPKRETLRGIGAVKRSPSKRPSESSGLNFQSLRGKGPSTTVDPVMDDALTAIPALPKHVPTQRNRVVIPSVGKAVVHEPGPSIVQTLIPPHLAPVPPSASAESVDAPATEHRSSFNPPPGPATQEQAELTALHDALESDALSEFEQEFIPLFETEFLHRLNEYNQSFTQSVIMVAKKAYAQLAANPIEHTRFHAYVDQKITAMGGLTLLLRRMAEKALLARCNHILGNDENTPQDTFLNKVIVVCVTKVKDAIEDRDNYKNLLLSDDQDFLQGEYHLLTKRIFESFRNNLFQEKAKKIFWFAYFFLEDKPENAEILYDHIYDQVVDFFENEREKAKTDQQTEASVAPGDVQEKPESVSRLTSEQLQHVFETYGVQPEAVSGETDDGQIEDIREMEGTELASLYDEDVTSEITPSSVGTPVSEGQPEQVPSQNNIYSSAEGHSGVYLSAVVPKSTQIPAQPERSVYIAADFHTHKEAPGASRYVETEHGTYVYRTVDGVERAYKIPTPAAGRAPSVRPPATVQGVALSPDQRETQPEVPASRRAPGIPEQVPQEEIMETDAFQKLPEPEESVPDTVRTKEPAKIPAWKKWLRRTVSVLGLAAMTQIPADTHVEWAHQDRKEQTPPEPKKQTPPVVTPPVVTTTPPVVTAPPEVTAPPIQPPAPVTPTPVQPAPKEVSERAFGKKINIDRSKILPGDVLLKNTVDTGTMKMTAASRGYTHQILEVLGNGMTADQWAQVKELNLKVNRGEYAAATRSFRSEYESGEIWRIKPGHARYAELRMQTEKFGSPDQWTWNVKKLVREDGRLVYKKMAYEKAYESEEAYYKQFEAEFLAVGMGRDGNIQKVSPELFGANNGVVQLQKDGRWLTYAADILAIRGLAIGEEGRLAPPNLAPDAPGQQPAPSDVPTNVIPQYGFAPTTPGQAAPLQFGFNSGDQQHADDDIPVYVDDDGEEVRMLTDADYEVTDDSTELTDADIIEVTDHAPAKKLSAKQIALRRKLDAKMGFIRDGAAEYTRNQAEGIENLLRLPVSFRVGGGNHFWDMLVSHIEHSGQPEHVQEAVKWGIEKWRKTGKAIQVKKIEKGYVSMALKPEVKQELDEIAAKATGEYGKLYGRWFKKGGETDPRLHPELAPNHDGRAGSGSNVDVNFMHRDDEGIPLHPDQILEVSDNVTDDQILEVVDGATGIPETLSVPKRWHPIDYMGHVLKKPLIEDPNLIPYISQIDAIIHAMKQSGLKKCAERYVMHKGAERSVTWKPEWIAKFARIMESVKAEKRGAKMEIAERARAKNMELTDAEIEVVDEEIALTDADLEIVAETEGWGLVAGVEDSIDKRFRQVA